MRAMPFDHNDRYHRLLLRPPVTPALMTLGQVREAAAALLPGCGIRRLLLWRYLLVFRRPQDP